MKSEQQYHNTLNAILEGIQIIDFDWRYVYLNEISVGQSKLPKEALLGFTMMEKYPGIEYSELFKTLKQCMEKREIHRVENQFTFPDGTIQWFDLRIQPSEEGICILSIDISRHKLYEEKIRKGKDLYAFLSQINQGIVHLTSAEALFEKACKVAIVYGKFKLAWIGLFADDNGTINLVEHCGLLPEQIEYFKNNLHKVDDRHLQVLESGTYVLCNQISDVNNHLSGFEQELDISSYIILPLRKSGKTIGTFNLYSENSYTIGNDEIALLQEVTSDISFALQIYENENKHRETEQIVLENERRFRALIEKSADMKTLATAEGKLFYGSPSITKVLGYDIAKMTGVSLFGLIHPKDIPEFAEKRNELLKNPGATFRFEVRMKHANGHWIWAEGSATNLLEETGVNAIVSNFTDITEKKIAQQQAEFDRNNTTALINTTEDLMWSVDQDLKLITSNEAFDKSIAGIYGKALQRGDSVLRSGLTTASKKQYQRAYLKSLLGKSFRQNMQLTQPKGHWAEISFSPILKGNETIGVACHSRDITERMKTKLALESQNKELIKTNFELDRFVYSVSHDLRSPLTSIMGLISFIEQETKESDTLEHTQMIKKAIHQLDGFIKNILTYSRNNRTETEVSLINLEEITNDVIAMLRHSKEADAISFEIHFEEMAPFYSDRQAYYTILENIISNAIKFSSIDNSPSYIKISGKSNEQFLNLKIEDNGIGIPEEHLERVFDMFFRSSAKIEGSGIGLYIVKEIIAKLEGTISISSETRKGTTFHISLKNLKP